MALSEAIIISTCSHQNSHGLVSDHYLALPCRGAIVVFRVIVILSRSLFFVTVEFLARFKFLDSMQALSMEHWPHVDDGL